MRVFSLLAAVALGAVASGAGAQEISLTAGGGVSTGDYGSSRSTTMANGSVGARWTSGRTTVSASIPFVSIDTPGVVFAGFDGTALVMLPDAGGPRRTHSGIGDPTFSVSHSVPVGSFSLRGTGRLKVPVQGYNGISTGKLDWSASGEISRTFGRITPFVSLGYRGYGDPRGWRIRDGLSGSVGASAPVGRGALAVSYEMARSTSRFVDDAREFVGVYDMPIGRDRMRLAAYGTVGVSDGAPGAGAGLRLSVRL
jgi:hypothetical protein